ncbi:MAG: ATP-binding protein, partial [Thermacetogeniaceae bacterium]
MALRNRVRMEFLSRPENVALARVAVATVASEVDFNLSDIEEIKVAVSEAVSNAVIHGYAERTNGIINLTIKLFTD